MNRSVGRLDAKIMFIGEAPGRLGADESGIPFHGDKAGHNFEELLAYAGLSRSDIYITNAVLCNPRDESGNNAPPTVSEIQNCSGYLREQIQLVSPTIVVTLGAKALSAVNEIEPHNLVLKNDVRTATKWYERIIIPLYHPGQRAMMSRSMANQRSDYKFVADYLKKIEQPLRPTPAGKTKLDVALIIEYLFTKRNRYTYFALHKLFYLIEYKSIQRFGYRLTNAYIIRQKDGPYCTDLNLFKLKKAIPTISSRALSNNNIEVFKSSTNLFEDSLLNQYELEEDVRLLLDEVINEYGNKSNASLKRSVYFTQPMRNILHSEIKLNVSMYNAPIEFNIQAIY
ncbi:MAG TPA: uracil-DNA glycosylase family protein [Flavipsychrobacter sp.]